MNIEDICIDGNDDGILLFEGNVKDSEIPYYFVADFKSNGEADNRDIFYELPKEIMGRTYIKLIYALSTNVIYVGMDLKKALHALNT